MHELESDSEAAPELVEQDVGPWLAAGATHKDWFGCVEEDDPYQSDSDSDMEEEDDEREVERDRVQAEMGAKEIEEGEAKAAAVQWGASVQLWGEDFYGTFMDVAAAAAASRDKGERERRLATLRQQKRRAAQKAHDVKSAAAATRVGVQRYFQRAWRFQELYLLEFENGLELPAAVRDYAMKKYKRHRTVPTTLLADVEKDLAARQRKLAEMQSN
jgi:hypothetical protein